MLYKLKTARLFDRTKLASPEPDDDPFAVQHVGSEGKGREGKGREGKGREGKGREGKGREGKGREGKGREGKGREGKGREGKGREGKGREGKGREGKGREGKARQGVNPLFSLQLKLCVTTRQLAVAGLYHVTLFKFNKNEAVVECHVCISN